MNPRAASKPWQYLMFHKPKGTIVALSDESGSKTVYDILPGFMLKDGWRLVGRLDRDSRGLLLFTREGGLINRLTQPGKYPKIYEVWIRGRITGEQLRQTLKGVKTAIGVLKTERVEILVYSGPRTRLLVTVLEWKNRHLRRIFEALQDPQFHTPLKVLDLKRIQIGTVKLDIPSSKWRFLTHKEESTLIRGTAC